MGRVLVDTYNIIGVGNGWIKKHSVQQAGYCWERRHNNNRFLMFSIVCCLVCVCTAVYLLFALFPFFHVLYCLSCFSFGFGMVWFGIGFSVQCQYQKYVPHYLLLNNYMKQLSTLLVHQKASHFKP